MRMFFGSLIIAVLVLTTVAPTSFGQKPLNTPPRRTEICHFSGHDGDFFVRGRLVNRLRRRCLRQGGDLITVAGPGARRSRNPPSPWGRLGRILQIPQSHARKGPRLFRA